MSNPIGHSVRARAPYQSIVKRPPLKLPGNARVVLWNIVNVEVWEPTGAMPRAVLPPPMGNPLLPDVPSITEYGYKEFDDYTWFGFMAPAGTPPDVVNKLNAALNRAMASADVVERFAQLGMASTPNTTTEFNNFLKAEVPKWAAVVKSSGAKAD
mgnify:CR=1 FL=1